MRLALEPYSENLIAEMRPLWDAHHTEIPQLGIGFDPDLRSYNLMAKTGAIRIFTARLAEMLVGYQVYFVGYHPHRRGSFEATQDVLYLDPEVRQGLAGYKFVKWCDKQLEKEGVKVIHHPIDARHDFGPVLERMGFELTDLTYSRRVA